MKKVTMGKSIAENIIQECLPLRKRGWKDFEVELKEHYDNGCYIPRGYEVISKFISPNGKKWRVFIQFLDKDYKKTAQEIRSILEGTFIIWNIADEL